jgi:hypothetical protein
MKILYESSSLINFNLLLFSMLHLCITVFTYSNYKSFPVIVRESHPFSLRILNRGSRTSTGINAHRYSNFHDDIHNQLFLAPLTRGGNLPFRRLCVDFGANYTMSEMVFARHLYKVQMKNILGYKSRQRVRMKLFALLNLPSKRVRLGLIWMRDVRYMKLREEG